MATKKKAPTKKTGKRRPTPAQQRSFKVSKEESSFLTFRLTHETIYWLILAILVIALAAWVLSVNNRVQSLYDQIQTTTTQNQPIPAKKH